MTSIARHMRLIRGWRDGFRYRAPVAGYTDARVLRAPRSELFKRIRYIGDVVEKARSLRKRWHADLRRDFGLVRGMLHNGVELEAGVTIGDVDRREEREYCDTISGARGDFPLGPKPGNPAT